MIPTTQHIVNDDRKERELDDAVNGRYPAFIMEGLRQNLGVEPKDKAVDGRIASMSRYEVLDRFLTWHGLIHYAPLIKEAVSGIYHVTLKEQGRKDERERKSAANGDA